MPSNSSSSVREGDPMFEEKTICIGCPLGCRTTLRINKQHEVVEITGYKCKEGRQYVMEEYRNPVRILTSTILTEKSGCPLLPVRTNRPILKSKLKEAALTLGRLRVRPPIQAGQTILSNLLDTEADVLAPAD